MPIENSRQKRDRTYTRRRDFAHLVPSEGPPRAFRIAANVTIDKDSFFKRYTSLFELGPDDTMEPYNQGVDISGYSYTKYIQRYRNIPIVGAEFVLTYKANVLAGIGRVAPHLTLSANPEISNSQ